MTELLLLLNVLRAEGDSRSVEKVASGEDLITDFDRGSLTLLVLTKLWLRCGPIGLGLMNSFTLASVKLPFLVNCCLLKKGKNDS